MSTDHVYLTCQEVERLCRLSRSTIHRRVRDGTFPAPVKMSGRAVRWRESDILAYLDSRPRSFGATAPA